MNTQDDEYVQRYTEEFNEQLRALAQHQNQALTMIFAERLRRDLTPPTEPLSWRQRLQGAYQQIKQQFTTPHQQHAEMVERPTEDDVLVIDAEYTVFSSVTTQTVKPTKGKEDSHEPTSTSRKRRADNTGFGPAAGEHGTGNPCHPNCNRNR
jgi:hypothetical protein